MTINSDLITSAFRESNFIGLGETPTTEELTEGLRLLQSLVDSLMGAVVGVKYRPWYVPFKFNTSPQRRRFPASDAPTMVSQSQTADVAYPPIQSRVLLRNTEAFTIYMQAEPLDGSTMSFVDVGFTGDVTIDGNGMFFGTTGRDTTTTFAARLEGRGPTREYVFREDTSSWNLTSDLALAGEMPFPSMFDDYWITALALRLSPAFGARQAEVTMMRFREMQTFIRGWYRPIQEALSNDIGRSAQSWSYPLGLGNPDGSS